MSLITRKPWLQKPPPGTPIDWSHPSISALCSAYALNEGGAGPLNAATGRRGTLNGTILPVWANNGLSFSDSSSYSVLPDLIINPTNDCWSLAIQVDITSCSAYILGANNTDAAAYFRNGIYLGWAYSGWNVTSWNSTDAQTQTSRHTWIMTRNGPGTYVYAYRDGKSLGPSGISTAVNTFTGFNTIGNNGFSGVYTILGFWGWNRTLSASEAASISANPWQIFKPQKRNLSFICPKPITNITSNTHRGYEYVDFGKGSSLASVDVTGQTSITSTSICEAWKAGESTSDHTIMEVQVSDFELSCSATRTGDGFTIYAKSNMGNLTGRYKLYWLWN